MHTYRIARDVTVLNDQVEVPGLGFLPVNAFVLHAAQPVVVDTGLGLADRDFVGDARDVPADDLRAAQLLWAAVDSPWVHTANTDRYRDTIRYLQAPSTRRSS